MLALAITALLAPVAVGYAAPAGTLHERQDIKQYETWIIQTERCDFPLLYQGQGVGTASRIPGRAAN